MNKFVLFCLLFFTYFKLSAQEYEIGLTYNARLSGVFLKSAQSDTLSLPFFDDFSGADPYPDSKYWADNNVFVNSTYEVGSVSSGVATFDALNKSGYIYDSKISFSADTLTSNPIKLLGKNSVHLSFFYQPGGLGDEPESQDTLKLEFKRDDGSWVTQFFIEGSSLKPFKQVILPVNTNYLYDGFQFRFINRVSPTVDKVIFGAGANADQWNLDYVFLDEDRPLDDTTYNDFVFTSSIKTILKNYQLIPWRHFEIAKNKEQRDTMTVGIKNMNISTAKVPQITVEYFFQDIDNPGLKSNYTYNDFNFPPQTEYQITEDINFDFVSSPSQNNANFLVRLNIQNLSDDYFNNPVNDTIQKIFEFKDYYAYDDGSSEGGYGIKGIGSENAMFAMKFHSYKRDTLKNIYMYFNATNDSSIEYRKFKLTVWNSVDGMPGNILWEKTKVVGSLSKEFEPYAIDEELIIEGDFFIGWQQVKGSKQIYLNVGLDKNNPAKGRAMINTNGYWAQSSVNGTIMIRAGFGTPVASSIENNHIEQFSVKLYPNPTSEYFKIDYENQFLNDGLSVEIFDIYGRLLMNKRFENSERINVSGFKKGVYIVVFKNDGKMIAKEKLLVQ